VGMSPTSLRRNIPFRELDERQVNKRRLEVMGSFGSDRDLKDRVFDEWETRKKVWTTWVGDAEAM